VRSKSLNGAWAFRRVGEDRWFDGAVPGGVYTDLRDAGEIPDPFYGDNELDVQWVGETDWEYRRTVDVGADEVLVRAAYRGPEESYPATAFFADYKALDLPDPEISVAVDGAAVTVTSDRAALFVDLDVGTLSGAFSDNCFHLTAGESRTVTFDSYEGKRDAVVAAEIEDRLSVRHLRGTY